MTQFEIVTHVTRELPCETAAEAAALMRGRPGSDASAAEQLLHLAVWRKDPAPTPSPLPDAVRQHLLTFFASVEGCAAEAETAFRDEVAAILSTRGRGERNER